MRPFVHDTWAALSYKAALGPGLNRPPGAPSWVPNDDARRLAAYRILAAYRDNLARYYLPEPGADGAGKPLPDPADKYREYGHAGLLIDQGRSLLLGEEQTIAVPDATPPADGQQPPPDAALAGKAKDWLEQWAEDEHLWLKLLELEEYAVGEGDGVFALGWDEKLNRPRLRVYNGGFYFPDLRDDADGFPTVVRIAYELEEGDSRLLRLLTWKLVDLASVPFLTTFEGEELPQAETSRRYPWQGSGEEPSTQTVVYSDEWFDLDKMRPGSSVHTLSSSSSGYIAARSRRPVDMGVDFIPVVHIPNDAAGSRHFGKSLLMRVAQLLDDLAATDTDLQANSELVGSTPTIVKGGSGALETGPGAQWNAPAGGAIAMLDTSKNLDAHLKYVEHLLDVMSVNSRLAAALLGRVKPNEVPSGYALELGFAATRSLIREMRMVRDVKYALLCKMAVRMAQAAKVLPAGDTPFATISLGPYLPADKAAAVDYIKALLPQHAISLETAVQVLVEAGFPIADAEQEVSRIKAQNFEGAVQLADATGDDTAVRDYLGLEAATPIPSPAPPAPTPPGA